ncbi:MAG: hypothetical protein ACXWLR_08210 [Myxococcales bacterium]
MDRVALDHVIARQVAALFDKFTVESCWTFRVFPADSFAADGNQHEVARFLAGALQRSQNKLEEALPCAA